MKPINKVLAIISICFFAFSCCPTECPELSEHPAYLQAVDQAILMTKKNDSLLQDYDSLYFRHKELQLSWIMLVQMFDSVVTNQPRDTVWQLPQCTLCYEKLDSVNGEQFYVGYDGVYYKVYQDSDTLIRKVILNDTLIIPESMNDIIISPLEKALLSIEARGTMCDSLYPYFWVHINGKYVRSVHVPSEYVNEYRFNVNYFEEEIDSIAITFNYDCYKPETNEDRNLWISSVKVNLHEYLIKENTELEGFINWDGDIISMPSHGRAVIKINK